MLTSINITNPTLTEQDMVKINSTIIQKFFENNTDLLKYTYQPVNSAYILATETQLIESRCLNLSENNEM